MNKEDRDFVIQGTAKALAGLIPGIGGAIGSILSDTLADRKEKRIKELIEGLTLDIQAHREIVNSDFIKQADFLDVFEITAKKVMGERSEAKRKAYRNILLTGILSTDYTYDDMEYQIRILDQLFAEDLVLLRLFKNPNTKEYWSYLPLNYRANTLLRLLRDIFKDWDPHSFEMRLRDLEILGLIIPTAGDLQTMMSSVSLGSLHGRLTRKGQTLTDFIIRD